MNDQYLKLAGGIIFFLVGVALIGKRGAYARWNAKMIREIWGSAVEPIAKSSKPGMVVFVAIGFLLIGSVFMITSIISLAA